MNNINNMVLIIIPFLILPKNLKHLAFLKGIGFASLMKKLSVIGFNVKPLNGYFKQTSERILKSFRLHVLPLLCTVFNGKFGVLTKKKCIARTRTKTCRKFM